MCRRIVAILSVGVTLALCGLPGNPTAQAQSKRPKPASAPGSVDANALVQKMIAAYRQARTVQLTSEARVIELGKPEYTQSCSLKYEAPNRLQFISRDPIRGTLETYSNGRTFTIYSGKRRIYTKRTAPTSMSELLDARALAAMDTFREGLIEILNPLSLIAGKGNRPAEATGLQFREIQPVEGRPAYLLAGKADPTWLKSLFGSARVALKQNDVLLWVDTKTNLLSKVIVRITYTVPPSGSQSDQRPVPGGFAFEEVHRGTVLNAPINPKEFEFAPPKDAVERYQER
jgi:outer membrane lipoprotein-sorting protein